jgi:hypothetical protein
LTVKTRPGQRPIPLLTRSHLVCGLLEIELYDASGKILQDLLDGEISSILASPHGSFITLSAAEKPNFCLLIPQQGVFDRRVRVVQDTFRVSWTGNLRLATIHRTRDATGILFATISSISSAHLFTVASHGRRNGISYRSQPAVKEHAFCTIYATVKRLMKESAR